MEIFPAASNTRQKQRIDKKLFNHLHFLCTSCKHSINSGKNKQGALSKAQTQRNFFVPGVVSER